MVELEEPITLHAPAKAVLPAEDPAKDLESPTTASSQQQVDAPQVSEDAPPTRSNLRLYTILAALSLELFIAALDQTIVATAVPTITAELHDATGYTWIAGAYLLASAATGPIWVKSSDIWGRKPAILLSIAIFAAASAITASAQNIAALLAGRTIQGAAAGGVLQLVGITISDICSIRHRALYLSSLGLVWVLAGTTGPVIGGALTEHVSWRWCFWINLPVCGSAFLVIAFFLDVHNPRTKLRDGLSAIDWLGTASILAGTVLFLVGLDFGGATYPWNSAPVISFIIIGAATIGFFLYNEKRLARFPLMYLDVFKGWPNNAIVITAFSHSITSFGAEYYLPLYFQSVKQASPTQSGVMLLPFIITTAFVDIASGVLIHKIGRYRELIWAGAVFMTLGSGLCISFWVDTDLGKLIGFQIILGFGVSLLFQTPSLALQNSVSQADTATAISTLSFIRALGTSISTVIGGAVFQNSMNSQGPKLAASGLNQTELDALTGYEAAANVHIVQQLNDATQRLVVEEAFASSIRNMFIVYTSIAAVGVVASVFIKQRYMSKEHTETKTGIQNMKDQKKR
ncbi:major facilitator superfamily domain-containing protein [Xylaria digitata]|nr:major facilitator superfamily domain-containing protein [Xylaria digitata]